MSDHRLMLRPDGFYIELYCVTCPGEDRLIAKFRDRAGAIPAEEVLVKMQRHLNAEPLGMPYACGSPGCTCRVCEY